MAIKDSSPASANGIVQGMEVIAPEPCLSAPFSPASSKPDGDASHISAQSQPGPIVHNKPTTVTLYASKDLKAAGLIPGVHDLINHAFFASQNPFGIMSAESLRLQSHQQLVDDLSRPGTFSYVITYTGTDLVIGVASAKRHKETVSRQPASMDVAESAFTRTGILEPSTEGWELSTMAVDPSLQRQGLAGLLVKLVEGEVKRRFVLERAEKGTLRLQLVILLSTVKEINLAFYIRRLYHADYETYHGPCTMGNTAGFTIVHMSKRIEV
ncbi:hypothetical protein WHR41_09463 [Cladosporium halotolerans]|uniref:N-acetyltransferase domain-containing protein n=1 Tax=Cladosporium halotolerans TaxID=1052096 RepID=A0AB34KA99_9PEZI